MARKLRIQVRKGIYHVLNRGNYRRDLFEEAGATLSFESCLIEAAERFEWKLHAFCLMSNHFHLVIELSQSNLSEGMQWLQVTHAARFNRYRHEQGRLFQGRFTAIPVETGTSLARVANYVHLNPVEAHLVRAEFVADYRWSSLHHFIQKEAPVVLVSKDWLAELSDSDVSNIQEYISYLQKLAHDRAEQKRQGWDGMNHGWAIGTQGWREAIAKDYKHLALSRATEAKASAEAARIQWQAILAQLLRDAGKNSEDLAKARKGAPWKLAGC